MASPTTTRAAGNARSSRRRLYRYDPATDEIRLVADDFDGPNGLAFSPDERRLYVAETGDQTTDAPRQYIRVFDVSPDGKKLARGEIFHKIEPGYCDGLRIDEDGNLWSSAGRWRALHRSARQAARQDTRAAYRLQPDLWRRQEESPVHRRLATLYAIFLNRRGVQWP